MICWFVRGAIVLVTLGASGCNSGAKEPAEETSVLHPKSFAAIGQQQLELSLLSPFSPSGRLDKAPGVVRDALLAREMSESHAHWVSAVERSVLARALLEQLEREALRDQPVQQSDLDQHRAHNWLFLDRPRAVRVFEALVPVKNTMEDEGAYRLAKKIRAIAEETHYPEDFAEKLSELREEHPELQANELPPVAEDSRVVPVIPFDMRFRDAPALYGPAVAPLENVGDVTEVIGSASGYHVLMALEIVPAHRPSDAEVGHLLRQGVAAHRMEPQLKALNEARQASVVRSTRELAPLLRTVWQR